MTKMDSITSDEDVIFMNETVYFHGFTTEPHSSEIIDLTEDDTENEAVNITHLSETDDIKADTPGKY